jgi:hypothetical protein
VNRYDERIVTGADLDRAERLSLAVLYRATERSSPIRCSVTSARMMEAKFTPHAAARRSLR